PWIRRRARCPRSFHPRSMPRRPRKRDSPANWPAASTSTRSTAGSSTWCWRPIPRPSGTCARCCTRKCAPACWPRWRRTTPTCAASRSSRPWRRISEWAVPAASGRRDRQFLAQPVVDHALLVAQCVVVHHHAALQVRQVLQLALALRQDLAIGPGDAEFQLHARRVGVAQDAEWVAVRAPPGLVAAGALDVGNGHFHARALGQALGGALLQVPGQLAHPVALGGDPAVAAVAQVGEPGRIRPGHADRAIARQRPRRVRIGHVGRRHRCREGGKGQQQDHGSGFHGPLRCVSPAPEYAPRSGGRQGTRRAPLRSLQPSVGGTLFLQAGTHRSQWSLSAACPGDRIVGLLFLPGSRMSPPAQVQARVAGLAVVSALAIVYVVWGSTYLGIRFALEGGWPPLLAVSGARFIVAGAAMYAFLRWRGVPAPTRAQWKNLAVMGLTLLLLGNGCVVLSEQSVSSGLAAVAVASVPLWMGVFGVVYGQRPTRFEWRGIAIGFAGVLWLNAGSSLAASPVGLVLLLVAPIGWAFGSV